MFKAFLICEQILHIGLLVVQAWLLFWTFSLIQKLKKKLTMKETVIFIAKVAVGTVIGLKIASMLNKPKT